MFCILGLCSDYLYIDNPTFEKNSVENFQLRLMRNTVNLPSRYRLRHMNLIAEESTGDDVCQWRGVTCDEDQKIVRAVHWKGEGNDSVDIDIVAPAFFPNTIKNLVLEDLIGARHFLLITRALPKEAENVHIVNCGIRGTIDLRVLPQRLVSLEMIANQLSGTVCLTDPPRTLSLIDLSENFITVVYVENTALPACFSKGIFSNPRSRVPMTVIETSGQQVDKRICVERNDFMNVGKQEENPSWWQCGL